MKILVIATGGTIGSTFDGTAINVDASQTCAVVDMYQREHDDAQFDTDVPLNILSESVTAADLNLLSKTILTTDASPYDGVIFTSGSDNLGYLAPFIGLLTDRWNKSVVIVATDKVLTDPTANGYPNFCAAIALIREGEIGAFVPYRNADGVVYIHSATDIRQADLSDDFFSFLGAYAVMKDEQIIPQKKYIKQTIPAIFDRDHLPVISNNTMLIHPYPLMDYATIDPEGKRAVLHTLYHSSTLDSEGLRGLVERLGDTPLYLASFRSTKNRYQTAVDAIALGGIPLTDISPECAYVKLMLACAQDGLSVREFMED